MSTGTPPTSKKAVSTRGNLGINFAKRYNHETVSRENINKHIEAPHLKGGGGSGGDVCGSRRGSGESGRSTIRCRGEDGEIREMEIVSAHERESVFQKTCPVLPVTFALVCAVLNLLPGIGTMTGVLGQLCCGQIHGRNVRLDMPDAGDKNYTLREKLSIGMAAAVLQLVLAPLVFGWIWSIRYGVLMVKKANENRENNQKKLSTGESAV